MTYALAWPLQEALFAAIRGHDACRLFFGDRVYDGPPPVLDEAAETGLYVTLGDEQARDWSTGLDNGARHMVALTVHAPRHGFAEAKQAAAAISDAVLEGPLAPSRGRVVNARFVDAKTRRTDNDALRQIEMRFSITLEDSA